MITRARRAASADSVTWLFTATIFLAAFLLFLIQPMVGKRLLVRFGGGAAVWSGCQLFFQLALLAGYAYAHLATAWLGVRRQSLVHLAVLLVPALGMGLPAAVGDSASGGSEPIWPLLLTLAASVGLPFFVTSVTSPMLQRWFAETGRPSSANPYFLYAASNAGSMLALIGYPTVVEPHLTLDQQWTLWVAGYVALAVLVVGCAIHLRRSPRPLAAPARPEPPDPPVAWRTRGRWVLLAAVPSSLLLGVTTHVTTDIAPVPLLWVVPLALYLLSFVLVFGRAPALLGPIASGVFCVGVALTFSTLPGRGPTLALHLLVFFAASVGLHLALVRLKPAPARLTEFYLAMSVGGVLGGAVNAVLAPLLLNDFFEYRAALVLACLLMPSPWPATDPRLRWFHLALPLGFGGALLAACLAAKSIAGWQVLFAAAGLLFARRPPAYALGVAVFLIVLGWHSERNETTLYRSRNFYGTTSVVNQSGTIGHLLKHGSTFHGLQLMYKKPGDRRWPLTYYHPTGPIGRLFKGNRSGKYPPVGLIGLGAGSLASYAAPGQPFTFFEIDPDVARVARNPALFTFVSESRGDVKIDLGDARQTLSRQPGGEFGVVVLDAFTSDAIPVHLLTVEAFGMYLDKLAPDGVIAVHVSNNYLDLHRVLDGVSQHYRLRSVTRKELEISAEESDQGKLPSSWVFLARTPEAFHWVPPNDPRWKPLPGAADAPLWTDDFANLFGVLRLSK